MDTIFDFIEPLEKILIILNSNGILPRDVAYFQAYREYLQMRSRRELYWNCIETLAAKYGLKVGTMRTKFKVFSQRLIK